MEDENLVCLPYALVFHAVWIVRIGLLCEILLRSKIFNWYFFLKYTCFYRTVTILIVLKNNNKTYSPGWHPKEFWQHLLLAGEIEPGKVSTVLGKRFCRAVSYNAWKSIHFPDKFSCCLEYWCWIMCINWECKQCHTILTTLQNDWHFIIS